MNLWEYVGKRIRVRCLSGKVFEGKCTDFTQALDNEPEIDSIGLETDKLSYELYENEIESIEVI
ncbi:MAG: hypothetical protein ABF633_02895 [Clostridium sp.]|uniref:hypothetical protein n=1 Tax=Clostridium sp. TaxID=1506 RepID=UPI0039E862EF